MSAPHVNKNATPDKRRKILTQFRSLRSEDRITLRITARSLCREAYKVNNKIHG